MSAQVIPLEPHRVRVRVHGPSGAVSPWEEHRGQTRGEAFSRATVAGMWAVVRLQADRGELFSYQTEGMT